ncbi:MAG: CAP domain-containing protein [Flavobacteriales bacterium]
MKFPVLFSVLFFGWTLTQGQKLIEIDTSNQRIILIEHNKERKALNIPNLSWNVEIASYAQEWAMRLAAEDDDIYHRDSPLYGENISWIGWISNENEALKEGVAMWNEEKVYFKYKPIGNDWAKSGHYTQVIWKKTTEVGCGAAVSASGAFYFVCNYNPHGNIVGEKPY